MGGSIGWTIRKEDGQEFRMSRWTNIIIDTITDDFLAGDPTLFDEAMESWLAMKADWEKHKEDGKFEHPMTNAYDPYPYGLKPDEYGIIVTDFKTKTLVSCQYYTNFTQHSPDIYGKDFMPDRYEKYKRWFETGRFVSVSEWKNRVATTVSFDDFMSFNQLNTYDEFLDFLRGGEKKQRYFSVTVKPPEGWTFFEFGETKDDRRQALAKIKELGFEISEDEQKEFDEWIEES